MFEEQLELVLPVDIPHRALLISKGAAHLDLIVETNKVLNLTRILDAREAAIKHFLDSVLPWHLFADARHVLDAGSGPGFPGIPLAIVLPGTRFTLAESIQKKARFLEAALGTLDLPNVNVAAQRAEDLWRAGGIDVITARALAPLPRALGLFGAAIKAGRKILLYKGPDADQEIQESAKEAAKLRARLQVVMRYELPDGLGSRTIVQIISIPPALSSR